MSVSSPSSAAEPQPRIDPFGEGCLSGASSLAILFGAEAEGPPRGRARAKMVLGPFAETKGTRLQGRNPANNSPPTDPSMKPTFVKEKPNLDSRLKMSGMTDGGLIGSLLWFRLLDYKRFCRSHLPFLDTIFPHSLEWLSCLFSGRNDDLCVTMWS